MARIKTLLTIILLTLLSLSCSSPTGGGSDSSSEPNSDSSSSPTTIAENEELFVDDGDGKTFASNVFEYGAGNGATYWTEILPVTPSFSAVTVEMSKISGHKLGGYGVFFSHRDPGSKDFSALSVFLNVNGEYAVGLIEDSSFSYIKDWTGDSAVKANYNVANTLSITEVEKGKYSIAVNGSDLYEFEDESEPVHDGGGYGYIAVVSPLENFPSEPVEVRFETIP